MAASVMNYHGSSLRLTGGITKSRTKTVSRMDVANPKKLKNVRKMLFGPVDREEAKRWVLRLINLYNLPVLLRSTD